MAQLEGHITVFRKDDGSLTRVGDAFSLSGAQLDLALEAAGLTEISEPTPEDAVREAAQAVDGYEDMTSVDLATAISQPAALRPTTLPEFAQAAIDAGATAEEFGEALAGEYTQSGGYTDRLENNLQQGDLASVQMLVAAMPPALKNAVSQATIDGIGAAVEARTLRTVDLVAQELGVTAPDPVTAADVDGALGRV